jgi:type I restriction enzyme M protein
MDLTVVQNEGERFERVLFSLLDLVRSQSGVQELPAALGLMALRMLVDSTPALSQHWAEAERSADIGDAMRRLGEHIESEHPELRGVFRDILLSGVNRIPVRFLQSWCDAVSRLQGSTESRAGFSQWIAFRLSEYFRKMPFSDRAKTPHGLAMLMVWLADIQHGHSVLDPNCGVGTLLAAVLEAAREKNENVKLFGQGAIPVEWALCKLCLYFLGADSRDVVLGHAGRDRAFIHEGKLQTFDRMICDVPAGGRISVETLDPIYRDDEFSSSFSKSRSLDTLFVQQAVARLKKHGRAVLLLPQGFLFRSGIDARIRERLIAENKVQAVIALPAKRLLASAIEVALLVLGTNDTGRILFLDAAARDNPKFGKPDMPPETIAWILEAFQDFMKGGAPTEDARCVSKEEVLSAYAVLLPRRYIPDRRESSESMDINELRAQLRELNAVAEEAAAEMDELLDELV